jgi:hypothetical protein
MAITRDPKHLLRTDVTLGDLAMMGFEVGKQCAQRLSRGYAVTPLQPDPAPLAVLLHFALIVDEFITDQRANNGLTAAGEDAYRAGYQRGLQAQLDNPTADVVLKLTRPCHV